MSATIMGAVWDLPVTPAEKLVLLAIADEGDGAEPTVAKLARKTGYSVDRVGLILRRLRRLGVVALGASA